MRLQCSLVYYETTRTFCVKIAILTVFFISILQPKAFGGPRSPCEVALRKTALISAGAITDFEKYVYLVGPPVVLGLITDIPKEALVTYPFLYMFAKFVYYKIKARIPVTYRGVLNYLLNLRLLAYDFSGKKILDVGSGESFFSRCVNLIYRKTGTLAIGLDLAQDLSRPTVFGEAEQLPFSTASFDLVVSSWAYTYYFEKEPGLKMLSEMIRVTKPGGEIHLRVLWNANNGITEGYLKKNADVVNYQIVNNFSPLEKVFIIKKRAIAVPTAEKGLESNK